MWTDFDDKLIQWVLIELTTVLQTIHTLHLALHIFVTGLSGAEAYILLYND